MIVKLPVATLHVGCVTELNFGCTGVAGCAVTVTLADAVDVQLFNLAVTV